MKRISLAPTWLLADPGELPTPLWDGAEDLRTVLVSDKPERLREAAPVILPPI